MLVAGGGKRRLSSKPNALNLMKIQELTLNWEKIKGTGTYYAQLLVHTHTNYNEVIVSVRTLKVQNLYNAVYMYFFHRYMAYRLGSS